MSDEAVGEPEQGEMTLGEAFENMYANTLGLAELTFTALMAMTPLLHSHAGPGDLDVQRQYNALNAAMNQLGNALMQMGSEVVKPVPPGQGRGGSGLILPR